MLLPIRGAWIEGITINKAEYSLSRGLETYLSSSVFFLYSLVLVSKVPQYQAGMYKFVASLVVREVWIYIRMLPNV